MTKTHITQKMVEALQTGDTGKLATLIGKVQTIHLKNKRKAGSREKNPCKAWASHTISNHRKNGHLVQFTMQELASRASGITNCPVCNKQLNWFNARFSHDSPSLDRIDMDNVMTLDNVWIICAQCNTTKGSRTLVEFRDYMLKALYNITICKSN